MQDRTAPAPRRHLVRRHPRSIYVREDRLTDTVHDFFAHRVLGPHRREHHDADLRQADANRPAADPSQARRAELDAQIADLQRRQHRLITELENAADISDTGMRQQFRTGIQERFAELSRQHQALQNQRDTQDMRSPD